MGRTPISEPCLFCLKLGLIPNLYMIFGITIPNFHMIFGIRGFFRDEVEFTSCQYSISFFVPNGV